MLFVPLVNLGDKATATDPDTDQAVFSMFESVRVVPRMGGVSRQLDWFHMSVLTMGMLSPSRHS
jgi:hypothetical protein